MPDEVSKMVTMMRLRRSSKNPPERTHRKLVTDSSGQPASLWLRSCLSILRVRTVCPHFWTPQTPVFLASPSCPCSWTHTQPSVEALTNKLPQKPPHLSGIPGVHPRHSDGVLHTRWRNIFLHHITRPTLM